MPLGVKVLKIYVGSQHMYLFYYWLVATSMIHIILTKGDYAQLINLWLFGLSVGHKQILRLIFMEILLPC
jgi:hypothetical protein